MSLLSRQVLKAAFLDRDGVLNYKPEDRYYIDTLDAFALLPEVGEAIGDLSRAGYLVFITSNQQAVAKGVLSPEDLEKMDRRLRGEAEKQGGRIERSYYCTHMAGACDCRKPLPGLLLKAFREFPGLTREGSFMVGDAESDAQAAAAAGVAFHGLKTNGNLRQLLRDKGIIEPSLPLKIQ